MVKLEVLKGYLLIHGKKIEDLAEPLKCATTTVYRKLRNDGKYLRVVDAQAIGKYAGFNAAEMQAVFFEPFVAEDATEEADNVAVEATK